jgi:translocation and assembly module TamB
MITARRAGRWALFAVGGALAAVVLLRVGLGIYLNTAGGKAFVGRQITARIGMPVEVTRVRVGLVTSTIGLKVFDPSISDPAKAEVFAVESADADVSLFGLARGHIAPKTVELKNVNLQLHVGADGKVLTTLPKVPEGAGEGGPLPAIKLSGGRVTIRQDGRPEFALTGVNVLVEPNGEQVKLSGTIDDPQWAKWTVSGEINQSTKTGSVELATPDGPLTMDRLGSIPFVPAEVWKHVKPNGRGGVALKLWSGSDHEVHYTVDIRPNAAELTLPDADVTLTQTSGLVRVSGAKVELQGTKAALATGTLAADGVIDFGPEPTTADVKVAAEGLDLRQLPPSWGLPREIEGKLKGGADLRLKIHSSGQIETAGGGSGEIVGAKIRDIPVTFKVELNSDGERYRFDKPMRMGGAQKPPPPTPLPEGKESTAANRDGNGAGATSTRSVTVAVRPDATRAFTPSLQGGGRGVGSARRACAQPPKQPDPKKPADPKPKSAPTTLDATITLRDIEIGELLQKLEVKLGYRITGKVTAELTLAVPLESATSRAAYEFTGKVSSPALTLEGLTIRDLSAIATYKNGVLTLRELKGTIPQPGDAKSTPGTFRGTATAAVDPKGEVTASLALDRIPLGEVLKALPDWTLDVKGTVSGKAEVKGLYDKLSDPTAWTGSAEVTSQELVFAGRAAKNAKLLVGVEKGTVALKELSATVEGIPVTATATLDLIGKYPFAATVKTTGTDVADLRKLVPELPAPVEGALETDTRVTGTISPFAFTASGTVNATKLTLAKTPANSVELKWEVTRDRFVIKSLKADVFGGSLSGTADVPFATDKGGQFDLRFKDFDIAAATPLIPDFPVRISGRVSGSVKGTIDPAKESQSRVGNLDVDLTAPKLTVQGIPAERLVGKAAVKGGVLEYSLEGKTLGGSFELKGRYPGAKKDAVEPPEPEQARAGWGGNAEEAPIALRAARAQKKDRGSFRLTGADLSRLAPELGFKSLSPLRGRLDISFDYENDLSAGSGRITFTGLQWGNSRVARDISAVIVLRNGILEVVEVSGGIAGGTVRGRARVFLNNTERNYFALTLTGADAKRLFAIVPEFGDKVDGPVTVTVRGRIGPEMRGSGTLTMDRGTVAGVTVAGLRIPFDWATAPGGYGRFAIRDASMHAGSGTATANLTAEWGVETRVDGLVKLVNVPLRTISPDIGSFALLGNGRITGRFDLVGRNVRSVDDLSGTLLATLGNTSPREVPIIQQAVPFLNPVGLVKPFETGDVRATLSRGVFRVERLALVSPNAQLFAEGNITTAGRVDMAVVAHTGTFGPESRAFRVLGLRLPAIGPIPVALLRDLGDLLSNRTVRLSITGTVSDPQVKVNVGALITEEVARFFLSRYVPADVAGVLGVGTGFGSLTGNNRK